MNRPYDYKTERERLKEKNTTTNKQEVIDTHKNKTKEEIEKMYEKIRKDVKEMLKEGKIMRNINLKLSKKYDLPRAYISWIVKEEMDE